jgi:hypothetical protein
MVAPNKGKGSGVLLVQGWWNSGAVGYGVARGGKKMRRKYIEFSFFFKK